MRVKEALLEVIVCAVLFCVQPAEVLGQPTGFPTRDVVVQFRNGVVLDSVQQQGGAANSTTQVYYSATARRIRTEMNGISGYTLSDNKLKRNVQIFPGNPPTYIETRMPEVPAARYVPTGVRRTIAGYECEEWARQDVPANYSNTECFTNEGLMLRLTAKGLGGTYIMEAVHIAYRPLDPSLFQLPPGALPQHR